MTIRCLMTMTSHKMIESEIEVREDSNEQDAEISWGEGAEVISSCIVTATNLIKQRLALTVVTNVFKMKLNALYQTFKADE